MPRAPQFIDNRAAARAGQYAVLTVDVARVLDSWRSSLFSYEWMTPDGRLKAPEALPPSQATKSAEAERKFAAGEPLEMPVLGIGLMDNVEIGAGRATFLTLARLGVRHLPVHVPQSHLKDFKAFAV